MKATPLNFHVIASGVCRPERAVIGRDDARRAERLMAGQIRFGGCSRAHQTGRGGHPPRIRVSGSRGRAAARATRAGKSLKGQALRPRCLATTHITPGIFLENFPLTSRNWAASAGTSLLTPASSLLFQSASSRSLWPTFTSSTRRKCNCSCSTSGRRTRSCGRRGQHVPARSSTRGRRSCRRSR